MSTNNIEKALEILDKLDFFNQRAGRELWNDKPFEVQCKDISDFSDDVAFLKKVINELETEVFILEATIGGVREANAILRYHVDNLQADNERLMEENKYLEHHLDCECSINADLASIIADEMEGSQK